MTIKSPGARNIARQFARLAALASAAMFLLSAYVAVTGGAASAGTNNGGLTLSPTSGSSATDYTVSFASGVPINCPGDSASGQYRVQSFVVPSGTNLDTLTFTSVGPSVGQPMYIATGQTNAGNAFVNGLTAITTGNINQLPGVFSFSFNTPGDFAAGTWEVGVACTQGTGSSMVKSYWTTPVTIAADAANGGPAQITWAVVTGSTTTTTTGGSTTTTTGGSTTTTTGGSTTTTTGGSTTTTDGSTTTTTGGAGVSDASTNGGTPSAASAVTTMGQLPYTGSSPLPMVFWAIALLVFGRMAMLLGKRPKVVGDDRDG